MYAYDIEQCFNKQGIGLTRDIAVVKYRDSFKEFMKKIRKSDFVLMLISDSYLKSKNCMYEVLEFIKDENYKERILPIVLNAKIYSDIDTIKYIKYWKTRYEELKIETKDLELEELISVSENQKIYREISMNIGEFIEEIKDMNHKTYNDLKEADFTDILKLIGTDVKKNNYNIASEIIDKIQELNSSILSLRHYGLEKIPKKLFKLKNLKVLELGNNKISNLPTNISNLTNLEILDLSSNKIREVPKEIITLKKLKNIDLSQNPIEIPPKEIAKIGIEGIRRYFEELQAVMVAQLYEAKLILVGEGGVGKTSLMKSIIERDYFNPNESITSGIDYRKWMIETEKSKEFRINLLDLGGQEIYHATHQFFLTKRSLYLLVLDARHLYEPDSMYYWLNIIKLLSDNAPIIIVLNKIDERDKKLDFKFLKEKFNNIVAFHKVSVKNGNGITNLVETIKSEISNLPHIGEKLPQAWVEIRNTLEKTSENYINYNSYITICKEYGLNFDQATLLSQYFHDLGTFLHFQDDSTLNQLIVLKPEWVTNAIYMVLNSKLVHNKFGEINKTVLQKTWDKYSDYQQKYFLELMKRFELCFEISNDQKILIPSLMKIDEPEVEWHTSGNLILRYVYEFLPPYVITRFIVRTHKFIRENNYWRNGLIINYLKSRALIKYNKPYHQIDIWVDGVDKNELLSLIRKELLYIHESLHNLYFKEMIQCPCEYCKNNTDPLFFDVSLLRKRLSKGIFTIECSNSFENVSLKEALGALTI